MGTLIVLCLMLTMHMMLQVFVFVFVLSSLVQFFYYNFLIKLSIHSDWNPHADLQAMARAHRLGQTNKVGA